MPFSQLNGDAVLLNIKTKDDETKISKSKTRKNDYANILKPRQIDNDFYKE